MKAVERQLQSTNREFTRFSRGALVGTGALGQLGRAAAFASLSFIGGAGIVVGIKAAVSAASNLDEQMSKTRVVFGAASQSVIDFSKDALQLSRDQALETASSIGALLRPMGLLPAAAAKNSVALTELGVDLASFSNTPVPEALAAIRSGLVGEVEPLRRYGVVLSEARVQQEALAASGKKNVDQLTSLEKVQARINIIMRDTAQAQGDAARTSGTFAGQQRELEKNLRNTSILLGQTLIPKLTEVTEKVNEWLGETENQERLQRNLTTAVDASATAFTGLATAIGGVVSAYKTLENLPGGDVSGLDLFRTPAGGFIAGALKDASLLGLQGAGLRDALRDRLQSQFPTTDPAQFFNADPFNLIDRLKAGGSFGQPGRAALEGGSTGIPGETAAARSAALTRDQKTLIDLARAQASGQQAAITAAANARLQFVRETIDFANRLIREGRGNTEKLANTLQSFYGEESSIESILERFASDAERANQARLDALAAGNRTRAEARQQRIDAILSDQKRYAEIAHEAYVDDLDDRDRQRKRQIAEILRKQKKYAQDAHRAYVDGLGLGGKSGTNTGGPWASREDFYAELQDQFAMYGSNIGPRGMPLSGQDSRASLAGVVKTNTTTVVQNFYGERGAGQALADAARVAKNMKVG